MKQDKWQRATAIASLLSVLAVAVGLVVTNNYNREQQNLAEQGQITDRFTKAVEQLGQPGPNKIDIRLGAIYALQRIMRDSAADQPAVVEILAAFIRVHAPARAPRPVGPDANTSPPVDIQAAVTVLGRRNATYDSSVDRLNLVGTQLHGADLTRADLADADLAYANLTQADLTSADLTGSYLRSAYLSDAFLGYVNLTGADLSGAHLGSAFLTGAHLTDAFLTGAHLTGADLTGADLSGAHLSSADLTDAHLLGAELTGADLTGANLTGANLNYANLTGARLRPEQLRCAYVTDATKLSPGVERPGADAPVNNPNCKH
ncbi:pentapeptide repeat-containing protein [Actinoplanes sp. NPDC051475]|uniref:pentapeptide repeat-containing protein n=1 Tax=Actinoplanes sp. NPDC051475 TaxID=3157225 RepID=UPI0034504D9A